MFLWKGLQARTIALALTGKTRPPARPAQGTSERARANHAATPTAPTAGPHTPKKSPTTLG